MNNKITKIRLHQRLTGRRAVRESFEEILREYSLSHHTIEEANFIIRPAF